MTRTIYCAIAMLFAFARVNAHAQPIAIGDTIPNLTLRNVLNHSADTLNLGDYRGKTIIFDFWSFNCVSCLQSFPKIDSLQRQFGDKLQVILVNTKSKEATAAFFAKRKSLTMPGTPLITTDTILQQLFPHIGVPFHVWIDDAGLVRYTTDDKYLTIQNLEKHLAKQNINLPVAEPIVYEPSLFKPEAENFLQYFSYLARCIKGGSYHIAGLEDSAATINTTYCVSIKDLYQFAYNETENEGHYKFREPGRTILIVSDKNKYERPQDPFLADEWVNNSAYYYHLSCPMDRKKDRYKIMQQDLNRYFNLEVKITKQKVSCLALIRTSSIDRLKTKGGDVRAATFSKDLRLEDSQLSTQIRNMPFEYLFNRIKSKSLSLFNKIIINRTGYKGNIDFELSEEFITTPNIDNFTKLLESYNLALVETSEIMDVLILKERGK